MARKGPPRDAWWIAKRMERQTYCFSTVLTYAGSRSIRIAFLFVFLLYLIDYVHQEFPIRLAGAGDRERESGAGND
jgi:hypothetical protein